MYAFLRQIGDNIEVKRILEKSKLPALIALLVAETTLWVLIVFFNFGPLISQILCYVSVCLAFLFSAIFAPFRRNKLITLGLLFTLCADRFLVFLNSELDRSLGMSFFLIVQSIYAIYLHLDCKKYCLLALIIRAAVNLICIAVCLIIFQGKVDYITVTSALYLANLVCNIICCCLDIKSYYVMLIGFVCFLLCDIHTGLCAADGLYFTYREGGFIYWLVNIPVNITWLFYIPSQTLLSYDSAFHKK